MSWSHSMIIKIEDAAKKIEADIEQLFHHAAVTANGQNANASPEQVTAAQSAAKALAGGITVPPGHDVSVAASGHNQAANAGSMPDSISVTVAAVPKATGN